MEGGGAAADHGGRLVGAVQADGVGADPVLLDSTGQHVILKTQLVSGN